MMKHGIKWKTEYHQKQSEIGDGDKTPFKIESLSYFVLNKIKRND